jgi:LmbE family N-acetylglucosaminyl deacetylase
LPDILPTESKEVFFYSPHPDDETLSFGVMAAELVANGYEVNFVLLSQGVTTKAIDIVNGNADSFLNGAKGFKGRHKVTTEGYVAITPAEVGAARVNEFRAAAGLLGADPSRVHVANTFDGIDYSLENISKTIAAHVAAHPHALHITMSTIDSHPQHRIAGEALRQIAVDSNVKTAYVVSRTTWKKFLTRYAQSNTGLPTPNWIKPSSAVSDVAVNATLPYSAWNPIVGAYAIGYTSVSGQFESLKTERDALYLLGTPSLDEVDPWIGSAEEETPVLN